MAKNTRRKTVVIGMLGTVLDAGQGPRRWEKWRPTVSLCQQEDLVVDRLELLYPRSAMVLAATVKLLTVNVPAMLKVFVWFEGRSVIARA